MNFKKNTVKGFTPTPTFTESFSEFISSIFDNKIRSINFCNRKLVSGFTLIELLVVIAIIGLLSTIITGPIQNGLKKGRDAKKIGDVMAIRNALAQYATDNNGTFPATLDALTTTGYLKTADLINATATAALKDKIMYVTYTVNSTITSYHLGVPLEAQNPALAADTDCAAAGCSVAGATPAFTNLGTTYGATTGTALGAGATDFLGVDVASTSACTLTGGVATCIYDIIP